MPTVSGDGYVESDLEVSTMSQPPALGARLAQGWARFGGPVCAAVVLWIYATNVSWHWFVMDDAYISFRYADNLVAGLGAVWNEGEYVEGYSNLLWVLLVAGGMALGIHAELTALGLSIAAGGALLVGTAAFTARFSGLRLSNPGVWVAPLLMASTRLFGMWATGGLETMWFAASVAGGIFALGQDLQEQRAGWLAPVLLGLAALLRPEGALFAGLCVAGSFVYRVAAGPPLGARLARWAALAGPLLGVVVGHLAARWLYYGDLVPNTFHAKVTGFHPRAALDYFELVQQDTGLFTLGLVAVAGALWRRSVVDALLLLNGGCYLAYLTYIGGDPWEFRMMLPILPMVAWAYAQTALDLWRRGPSIAGPVLGVAFVVGFVTITTVSAAQNHNTPVRAGVASLWSMRDYTAIRIMHGRRVARIIDQGLLPADLRIATGGAGALPYFAGTYTVDMLGLTDRIVAVAGDARAGRRRGHKKSAGIGYLSKRRIDMVDVAGGFVFPTPRPSKQTYKKGKTRVNLYNRGPRGLAQLKLRCRTLPKGHLFFASPLPPEEFEERFGHLPPCPRTPRENRQEAIRLLEEAEAEDRSSDTGADTGLLSEE